MKQAFPHLLPTRSLLLLLILSSLFWNEGMGQDQEGAKAPYGTARIEGADTSGYYRFSVQPSLQKHLQPELQDLRIIDENGKEIPYLFEKKERTHPFRSIRSLDHVKQKSQENGGLFLELKDPDPGRIEGLALEVDRSPVSRSLKVMASEDGNSWKEVVPMRKYHDEDFPDGTRRFIIRDAEIEAHRYYRIEVSADGDGPDPRIRTASVIEDQSERIPYSKIPDPTFASIEKRKRSYIPLEFDAPTYRVHGIEMRLEGPDFFYRQGFIARGDPGEPDSLKKLASFDLVSYEGKYAHASADERSAVDVTFYLDGVYSQQLVLVIDNRDHASLNIQDVRAYQRERRIFFQTVEGQKAERLVFGDPGAKRPRYELPHFRDRMPDKVPELRISELEWNGPELEELLPEDKKLKKREGQEHRTATIVGFILVWVLGISVLVAVVILWKRGIL